MERYARQSVFSHIGTEGQEKLLKATVTIVGMGALGTVAANNLCRAGVGHIRMIDRDYVETTNLQRQVLYDENDVAQKLPKVIAAYNHLSVVNSQITLEPVIADVNSVNIEQLIQGCNMVLDATDNWETRLLLNEACIEHAMPWIYCGAIGAVGMTMNIMPGSNTPCLKCFMPTSPAAHSQTCSSFGVLNTITNAIASVQTTEALKFLIGSSALREDLLIMDLWNNDVCSIEVEKNPSCPACVQRDYEYLGKTHGAYATSLCGSDAVQVVPATEAKVDFEAMAKRLESAGTVKCSPFSLTFASEAFEMTLFRDGRAIIKNAIDENNAKSIYAEYIGI